jgi:genome maintenance exonuclease 1
MTTTLWRSTSIPFQPAPHAAVLPSSQITFAPVSLPITLNETMRDGKRWYVYQGEYYPSITTMISATDDEGNNALKQWRTAVGHDAATRITSTAARRGTQWHTFCEQFVARQPVAWANLTEPNDISYAALLGQTLNARIASVIASETRVVSSTYGLAGRLDMAIQLHDGRYAILDFKTGKKPKTGNRLQNYGIQAAFYADALTEHWKSGIIDTIVIAQLLPDRILWQESDVAVHRPLLRERIDKFATLVNTQLG